MALAVFYLVALVKNIYKFTSYEYIAEWIRNGLVVFELCIVCWYLLKALNHPDLFRNVDSKLKLVDDLLLEKNGIPNEASPDKDSEERLLLLKDYMRREEAFLEPDLTIKNVATAIGVPVKELSILINHTLNQHFFDFVNAYRIEAAMEILKNPAMKQQTVLEILYEVGFNSKSSFNTSFKKHTGVTPTAYRRQHLN